MTFNPPIQVCLRNDLVSVSIIDSQTITIIGTVHMTISPTQRRTKEFELDYNQRIALMLVYLEKEKFIEPGINWNIHFVIRLHYTNSQPN
jgi:hypothetical protein